MLQHESGPRWISVVAVFLFAVLAAELVLSIRQESQTFDESAHLYAGYSYWKTHDFGINPEHPPLAKLIAALPLLPLRLAVNPPPPIYFRGASSVGGRIFLYSHDADSLLLRGRLAISIFTFALALLVFFAAREMFGWQAALIATGIFVFEPNILAHGALITTDMAVTAMLFGAVYTFYRYLKQPTIARLLVCGLFAGLTLAVKHSGVLLFPILFLVAAVDLAFREGLRFDKPGALARRASKTLGALAVIAAMSVTILWSCYGFRYAARPGGASIMPSTGAFVQTLRSPTEAHIIGFFEKHHLLPEAYLYGVTDIINLADRGRPTYLFGKLYATGHWFYFPSSFIIKSTIGFMLLLAIALCVARLWKRDSRREALFLLVPAAVYLLFAVRSKLDLGNRHILPIYPFLIVLAAAGAWALMRQSRVWAVPVAALLLFHAASSLRAYPAYLAYSNEFWGGPSNTYKVLADSNLGWTSGLKTMQRYTREHGIQHCWFAYYGPADISYFHLPCDNLPTYFSSILGSPQKPVPEVIQGPVFVMSENLPGAFWGPAEVNPYRPFNARTPDAVLDGEIMVYNGSVDVRSISGLSHFGNAITALRTGHPDLAQGEAQQAVALAPELMVTHALLAQVDVATHHTDEAQREYEQELNLYHTTYAEFSKDTPPPENPVQPTLAKGK